jgi:hypothetical protein
MSLVNTKSMLAKLLASENITVEHGNYQTASMDVKNRILRLPIWKEMSGSLYDLMVLHEVGHALYTPEDGWHESASDKGSGYKSFLNVVEDARIERKIKDKYPGGRKAFTEGYLDLIEKDFFGIKGVDLNTLNLIDRINLYFKGGFVHDIEFTEEELEFVEKVRNTMTWDDVVRVTNELYEYAKENESETDMSDHSMMSMADSGDDSDDLDMDMEGEESADPMEGESEELGKRGLEASDEEKEDSETDGPSAENEGEDKDSDSEGKSVGDESAEGEGDSESKDSSDKESEDSSGRHDDFGGGASRGEMVEGGKSVEIDPSSFTDKIFRNREGELVQDADSGYVYDYGNMPVADTSKIIVDHKEIHEVITKHYKKSLENFKDSDEIGRAQKGFIKFRSDNKKTVEYLAKEFEMKKAADAHSRTATANSGIIDTGMLHEYKYNEHIFKKINVTADGKNHGLVMVVDWSGSMNGNIKGTIEQMMVLVMFAKRVNIPFEVFLFSDSYPSEARREFGRRDATGWTHKDGGKNGDLVINGFNLLNVFSSRMRANELHTAYINMTALAQCFDSDGYGYYRGYRTMPSELTLGGTPLNDSLLTMHTYLPEFKVKNNVQIVNLIYLTDGDSAGGEYVWDRRSITRKDYTGNPYEKYEEIRNLERGYRWNRNNRTKTIIRDTKSKKEYTLDAYGAGKYSRNEMTNTLVEILRDAHGVNVVNFYIIPKLSRYDIVDFVSKKVEDRSTEIERLHSCWRKEGHIIGENYGGWTELYLIRGGKNLDVKETNLDVNTGAKKGEIKRAFSKMNKNKLKNRLLLSKFVDMVAA